ESLDLTDAGAALLRANADMADRMLMYATVRLGGTDYVGWAMNTDLGAASEHRLAPWDSFATFGGHHYAAGAAGIVRFTGDAADDQPIDAWIKTFLMNFGTDKLKRAPEVWIGATDTGAMVLK